MENKQLERACFAAGCFWGVEARFQKVLGVVTTMVGYTGGVHSNPTYAEVCSGKTGHAEAVYIEYDSAKVTYEELLSIFWQCHDCTQVDRQGPDVGSQYRSVIFFYSQAQKAIAERSMQRVQRILTRKKKKMATQLLPAQIFYIAEERHQNYIDKHRSEFY